MSFLSRTRRSIHGFAALGAVALAIVVASCKSADAPREIPPASRSSQAKRLGSRFETWPAISGLVEIGPDRLVVVHDVKPKAKSPALGLVRVGPTAERNFYEPIAISPPVEPPLNDIEAIALVPPRNDVAVILESGGAGTAQRAVLVEFAAHGDTWSARTIGAPVDLGHGDGSLTNIEALAVESASLDASTAVVLVADRSSVDATRRAEVVVQRFALDFAHGSATSRGEALRFAFALPASAPGEPTSWRACSDFLLEPDGGMLVAAASDPGDVGPFASIVYRVSGGTGATRTVEPVATIDGLKVEGLARVSGTTMLWIGSDDEAFGGVVRPIALAR
ncbi:MAG: hypothetical protein U0572_12350 [Phycisphaerales bacterium]